MRSAGCSRSSLSRAFHRHRAGGGEQFGSARAAGSLISHTSTASLCVGQAGQRGIHLQPCRFSGRSVWGVGRGQRHFPPRAACPLGNIRSWAHCRRRAAAPSDRSSYGRCDFPPAQAFTPGCVRTPKYRSSPVHGACIRLQPPRLATGESSMSHAYHRNRYGRRYKHLRQLRVSGSGVSPRGRGGDAGRAGDQRGPAGKLLSDLTCNRAARKTAAAAIGLHGAGCECDRRRRAFRRVAASTGRRRVAGR